MTQAESLSRLASFVEESANTVNALLAKLPDQIAKVVADTLAASPGGVPDEVVAEASQRITSAVKSMLTVPELVQAAFDAAPIPAPNPTV